MKKKISLLMLSLMFAIMMTACGKTEETVTDPLQCGGETEELLLSLLRQAQHRALFPGKDALQITVWGGLAPEIFRRNI